MFCIYCPYCNYWLVLDTYMIHVQQKMFAIVWSTYFYLWFIFCFCLLFIFHLASFKYIILAVHPRSPCESRCFSPPYVLPSPFFHTPSYTAVHGSFIHWHTHHYLNFLLSAKTPYLRHRFFFIMHITNSSPIYRQSR